jgi:hypothetical protein
MNRFDKAVQRIETYGWRKQAYGNFDMGFCILGAMNADTYNSRLNTRERAAVASAAWQLGSSWIVEHEAPMAVAGCLVRFNDEERTTEEDVLLLLKTASAAYNEQSGG